MANDDPFEVNYPDSLPIEKVSGQPTGGVTGIKSVKPFRAAAWADNYADGTPKDAPPTGGGPLVSGAKQIPGLWSRFQNDPQSVWDAISRGANKALATGERAGEITSDAFSPSQVGGEAAPMPVGGPPAGTATVTSPSIWDKAPAVGKPMDKIADVFEKQNPAMPLMPPGGSLIDTIVKDSKKQEAEKAVAAEPTPTSPSRPLLEEQQNRPGLFGVPGLLGKFGENVHNWTDQRRMQLLALAGGLAGAPSLGQGFGKGFTAAANAMPEQQKLNTQNATVNYLMKNGMDQSQALAIMGNPQLTHEIMGQMSGILPPKTMAIEPGKPQLNWIPGKGWQPVGGAAGSAAGGTGVGDPNWDNMSVDQRLKAVEAQYGPEWAAGVKSIGEGRQIPPNRLAQLFTTAQRVYPGLQMGDYTKALKTQNDFGPQGVSGKNITAIETAIGHVDRLQQNGAALNNFNIPALNVPWNMIRAQLSPDFQYKVSQFEANATGASGELAKAFRAAGMSEADIDRWLKMFNRDSGPATINGAAAEAMHMLDSRLDAIADSYNRGMPAGAPQKGAEDFLGPKAKALRDKVRGIGAQGQTAPQTQGTGGTQGTVPPGWKVTVSQ